MQVKTLLSTLGLSSPVTYSSMHSRRAGFACWAASSSAENSSLSRSCAVVERTSRIDGATSSGFTSIRRFFSGSRQLRSRLWASARRRTHLTVESYMVIYAANSYTYIISFPSPTLSFIQDFKKTSFSVNPFPLQPFFFFFRTDYMIPQTFTVTSSMSVFTFYFFCFTIFSCRFRAVD